MTASLIVFTVVGALAALSLAGYSVYVMATWPRADATVLRYYKNAGGEGVFYHPVYMFSTLDGQTVIAISSWGSWRRPWARGAALRVAYCPANPRRTEVQCFANNWGISATIVGLVALAWIARFVFS